MTYAKVAIIILAVLSAFSAIFVIAGLGLMSAEDYSVREQAAYESFCFKNRRRCRETDEP